MILDVEPVPNIAAGPVHRKLPAFEAVDDRQWDKLFEKVVGPIVVGAIGDQDRQAIGVMPTADQVVGRSLRCGIGRSWIVRGRFRKTSVSLERAKNLVGRDVVEAKCGLPAARQTASIAERRFQRRVGADDIGLNERGGGIDGPIDVAFGGQMHHDVRLVAGEDIH